MAYKSDTFFGKLKDSLGSLGGGSVAKALGGLAAIGVGSAALATG